LLQPDPRIGKTVSHYRVTGRLGGGGMGVVYLAEDTRLKRTVALKFLPVTLLGNEESKKRFMIEAQAASALDHPRIGTIFEIDETSDGEMFIAMAYYEGATLKDRIATGPVPCDEAFNLVQQIANGLAEAHAHGIIHRDVKPANIIITKDGYVKIVDFGLAKLGGATQITKSGTSMGTPAYMSPEQVKGKEVDHRADIWALGVILYELLTGKLPFTAENDMSMLYNIVNEAHTPFSQFDLNLPAECAQLIEKTLAKSAEDRYASIQAFMADLQRCRQKLLRKEDVMETVIVAKKPDAQPSSPSPEPVAPRRKAHKASKRPLIIMSLLTAIVVVAAFTMFKRSSPEPAAGSAYVRISSTPENARIVLNGDETEAQTPTVIGPLQPGDYSLTLVSDGFQEWRDTLSVAADDTTDYAATLYPLTASKDAPNEPMAAPPTGTLVAKSQPTGARIYLNGQATGETTPATLREIPAGTVAVQYRLKDYQTAKKSTRISAGQRKELSLRLLPLSGSLRVTSTPAGAEIFIDGKASGQHTPHTLTGLPPGDYALWLNLPDFLSDTLSISVRPNKQNKLNFVLKKPQAAEVKILAFVVTGASETLLPGAEIFVNGTSYGQTPLAFTLKPGTYKIGAKYFGYNLTNGEQTIRLRGGEKQTIKFHFAK